MVAMKFTGHDHWPACEADKQSRRAGTMPLIVNSYAVIACSPERRRSARRLNTVESLFTDWTQSLDWSALCTAQISMAIARTARSSRCKTVAVDVRSIAFPLLLLLSDRTDNRFVLNFRACLRMSVSCLKARSCLSRFLNMKIERSDQMKSVITGEGNCEHTTPKRQMWSYLRRLQTEIVVDSSSFENPYDK